MLSIKKVTEIMATRSSQLTCQKPIPLNHFSLLPTWEKCTKRNTIKWTFALAMFKMMLLHRKRLQPQCLWYILPQIRKPLIIFTVEPMSFRRLTDKYNRWNSTEKTNHIIHFPHTFVSMKQNFTTYTVAYGTSLFSMFNQCKYLVEHFSN